MKKRLIFLLTLFVLLSIPFISFAADTKDIGKDEDVILSRKFVTAITSDKFDEAISFFDKNVAAQLDAKKLEGIWKMLQEQVGLFKQLGAARKEKQFPYQVVYIRMIFELGYLDAKVVLDREGKVASFYFAPAGAMLEYSPPDYTDPEKFTSKDISFGIEDWELPGTLLIPKGEGPFPAVVLVHGSGPNDRNESVGECKPFEDLALGLASRGIAVLRYEKRTKHHAYKMVKDIETLTINEETIDDAVEAVKWLENQENIDPKRIFVLGHSLGGMVFPRIGKDTPDVKGFIAMAGGARPLDDIIMEQVTYLYNLDGKLTDREKSNMEKLKKQIERLKSAKPEEKIPPQELPMGLSVVYWQSLNEINPVKEAAELKQPLLMMQGGEDYQVTKKDFDIWEKGLSGKKNAEFKFYPKLNHLFVESKGKSSPLEYFIPGHVSKQVVEDIADWIKKEQ